MINYQFESIFIKKSDMKGGGNSRKHRTVSTSLDEGDEIFCFFSLRICICIEINC